MRFWPLSKTSITSIADDQWSASFKLTYGIKCRYWKRHEQAKAGSRFLRGGRWSQEALAEKTVDARLKITDIRSNDSTFTQNRYHYHGKWPETWKIISEMAQTRISHGGHWKQRPWTGSQINRFDGKTPFKGCQHGIQMSTEMEQKSLSN